MPLDASFESIMGSTLSWMRIMLILVPLMVIVFLSLTHFDFLVLMPLFAFVLLGLGLVYLLPLTRLPVGLEGLPPSVESTPVDWTWFWNALAWVWFGLVFALKVAAALGLLYGCYRLPQQVWSAFVWYVNPPPMWLARWLGRDPIPYLSYQQYCAHERLHPAHDDSDVLSADLQRAARTLAFIDGHVWGRRLEPSEPMTLGRVLTINPDGKRQAQ